MDGKDAIADSASDIITTTTGTMFTSSEQKEFSDLIDEYEDRSIALQQKIVSLRRRMRNLIADTTRNEKEIETLRKEVGELKVKLRAANAGLGGEQKPAEGFVVSVLLSRGRFAKRGFDFVEASLEDMLESVGGGGL
jgi:polyhydroxyalkanoate synthesis regulator phasin